MKRDKEIYESPKAMIVNFASNEVITTSAFDGYSFIDEGNGDSISWVNGT